MGRTAGQGKLTMPVVLVILAALAGCATPDARVTSTDAGASISGATRDGETHEWSDEQSFLHAAGRHLVWSGDRTRITVDEAGDAGLWLNLTLDAKDDASLVLTLLANGDAVADARGVPPLELAHHVDGPGEFTYRVESAGAAGWHEVTVNGVLDLG